MVKQNLQTFRNSLKTATDDDGMLDTESKTVTCRGRTNLHDLRRADVACSGATI